MSESISLTAGMRSNLVALQGTEKLLNRTQERLATGKEVNSAIDNPTNFFAAQGHMQRAGDLDALKDSMGEAVQIVKAADEGIEAITALIENAKALAQSAKTAGTTDAAALAAQFDVLRTQIDRIAADSDYKGTNLLGSDTVTVTFDESGDSTLAVAGFDGSTTGLSIAASAGSWATSVNVDAAITDLDSALSTLRTNSSTLSANLNVITVRQDFTEGMINTLTEGADNLTLADMNEEGANMLMLQTRQSLSSTALSLSAQAAQSVLRLF